MFEFFLDAFVTLILLIPFGLLVMYALIAFRQLVAGSNEKNLSKIRGGRKALLLVLASMVIIFLLWLYLISKIG